MNERLFGINAYDGQSWKDVTEKKVIIYGAGQGCIDMMEELLIPNVEYIIDSNSAIQGEHIMLMSRIYKIDSPDILNCIDCSQYYIVVSSEKYYEEIKKYILELCGSKYLVCLWKDELRFCYTSLEAMLLTDNCVRRKLANTRLTRDVYKVIDAFQYLKSCMSANVEINRYIPIKDGWSKFSFVFGNDDRLWIFHYMGYVNSIDPRSIEKEDRELKKKRDTFIDKYGIDSDLTLCRNGIRSMIQIYAGDKLDFSLKDVQEKVLIKMRELHQLPIDNLSVCKFTDVFYRDFIKKIDKSNIKIDIEKIKRIGEKSAEYIDGFSAPLTVIHGDLICDNIVLYGDKICFIDWEFLSVGLPEFDICYFLYSIYAHDYCKGKITYNEMCKKCYREILPTLKSYYISEFEQRYQIARAVMDLCILRGIIHNSTYNIDLSMSKLNDLYQVKNLT